MSYISNYNFYKYYKKNKYFIQIIDDIKIYIEKKNIDIKNNEFMNVITVIWFWKDAEFKKLFIG